MKHGKHNDQYRQRENNPSTKGMRNFEQKTKREKDKEDQFETKQRRQQVKTIREEGSDQTK